MRIRRRQRKIDLAGGGEREPGGAERRRLCRGTPPVGANYRAVTGDRPYGRQDPLLEVAFFEARGDEAQRVFGALRHCPVLPAQPDESF